MSALEDVAPAFVGMAHQIVWASVATVGADGRPRSRMLHPIWEWDGTTLTGWIATGPTPIKRAHIAAHPYVSINYWASSHDTCSAEASVEWVVGDAQKIELWNRFKEGPAPVGYDPAIIEPWADGPTSPAFSGWKLTPSRLRVMPGTIMTRGTGELLTWRR
ncbi:pyridoxamine 5-phosphate oxidase [Mycobacterium sp. MS1601]|uniref:pyridoxamine 5'-phosphate oxidase family protein n=1 Tax=Mycobacterium sp. MS1601 TaxID=1936029 RepID=UPI0009796127|nr:pyridoxamine 5'-phosphate oxidase family protein [Mycobacterium sp. MS1601]AQA01980.1 pyridoxamine 5-phosphate oxidase [Mycobacterium sp. MS1601]